MAKRIGSVIVFKKGVSKEQAAKALALLSEVAEFPKTTAKPTYFTKNGQKMVKYDDVPFEHSHAVNEYDDEYGGPVWYIP